MSFDYDLFVIGAGSGGVRASRIAAGFGAKVAVAENHRYGGTCVIRGCVPKKLLVYASHFREDFEDARGFGWSLPAEPEFSWPTLIASKNREIARLEGIYQRLLENAGVTPLRGRATVTGPNEVELEGRRIGARYILVATGGWPKLPAIPGIEHAITSNEAFELPDLPRRMLMVGGGYIAVEFAGIFHGLGSEVTLAYRGGQILRGFDRDVRDFLAGEIGRKGIRLELSSEVRAIEKTATGLAVSMEFAGKPATLEVDAVMYATGRAPNTAGLGLEKLGVNMGADGQVIVDEYGRSSVPSIWAVGDVTHRYALTPVAIREGQAAATTLFGGGDPVPVDHDAIPSAVFSQPPVSTVGLTEEAALARLGAVDIYKTDFRPMKHTLSGNGERTLMKLVVDHASQRVLGAHMVGADAPEIIQGVAIAVKAGLTKRDFDMTVGIHPTAAEEFVTLREKKTLRRA